MCVPTRMSNQGYWLVQIGDVPTQGRITFARRCVSIEFIEQNYWLVQKHGRIERDEIKMNYAD